jgi:hypothetical protein
MNKKVLGILMMLPVVPYFVYQVYQLVLTSPADASSVHRTKEVKVQSKSDKFTNVVIGGITIISLMGTTISVANGDNYDAVIFSVIAIVWGLVWIWYSRGGKR